MKPRIEELINRDIDGEISREEGSELRTHLAEDPESRAYYEDLKKVAGWLGRVPPVEAPPSLKPEIMAEVRARSLIREAPAARTSGPSLLQRWLGWGALPRPAYAWSAAAGFAAGILVFALWQGELGGIDHSEISGTMAPSPGAASRLELGPGGIHGSFAIVSEETGVQGVLHLVGTAGIAATIAYDDTRLSLSGIRWEGGTAEVAATQPGVVRMIQPGNRSYTLWWDGPIDTPISFTITTYLDGQEVEQTLRLP